MAEEAHAQGGGRNGSSLVPRNDGGNVKNSSVNGWSLYAETRSIDGAAG